MGQDDASTKKYEEYVHVLDFNLKGKSVTSKGRDGVIFTAIGEDRLIFLEVLGITNSAFEIGERVYVGKDRQTKIQSVLGRMYYGGISKSAKNELAGVLENIVFLNESKFVEYINNAPPLTIKTHALSLTLGVGKVALKTILEEREEQKFESYYDLQDRVRLKDPVKQISKRIMEEITGMTHMNLFVN